MKNEMKLYNLIFPVWMLIFFPPTWIAVLPANFIVDSLVLLITLKVMKIENKKEVYKKSIMRVWIFGFISDFICAAFLFATMYIPEDWWGHTVTSAISYNPFKNPIALIVVLISIIIAGAFIYLFNYKVSFKKTELSKEQIKKISLAMAIVTAPYVVLIPMSAYSKFLYGF